MSEATITDANENTSEGTAKTVTVEATTGEAMRELGKQVAHLTHGGDVILLSGPLGAGKTTFAQGFGAELNISEPIVSPTFTIARKLKGQFPSGNSAHLIHVDAYRLGGNAYAPGQNAIERLLDELESLGLERKPENVLIYATSNRRHLIKETFKDKADRDEELHTNDTVQEKLSLVARFGVTIYFGKPDKKEFQEIVRKLAQKSGIDMPEDELLLEANKWELSHGGLSGRTAQQFVDYLAGMQ